MLGIDNTRVVNCEEGSENIIKIVNSKDNQ